MGVAAAAGDIAAAAAAIAAAIAAIAAALAHASKGVGGMCSRAWGGTGEKAGGSLSCLFSLKQIPDIEESVKH